MIPAPVFSPPHQATPLQQAVFLSVGESQLCLCALIHTGTFLQDASQSQSLTVFSK